jgi:hypothetical protein
VSFVSQRQEIRLRRASNEPELAGLSGSHFAMGERDL